MGQKSKELLRNVLVAILFMGVYFGLHLGTVEYKGQKMLVYKSVAFRDVFSDSFDAFILGTYTLQTEYGSVTLFPRCEITTYDNKLSYLDTDRNVAHNITFFNLNLPKKIGIDFDIDIDRDTQKIIALATMDYEMDIPVDKEVLHIKIVRMFFNPDEPKYQFHGYFKPGETITLSDGSVIECVSRLYNLRMYENGIWEMKWSKINPDGTAWEGSFLVTRPGEKEGKKYGLIRFQENWGAFIDGASAE